MFLLIYFSLNPTRDYTNPIKKIKEEKNKKKKVEKECLASHVCHQWYNEIPLIKSISSHAEISHLEMEKDGQTVTSHEIWYPREVSCSCRIEDSLLFLFLLLFFFFFMLWWLNCDGRQIRRIQGSYCFDLCMREREGVVWFRWGSEKDTLKWIYTHTQL